MRRLIGDYPHQWERSTVQISRDFARLTSLLGAGDHVFNRGYAQMLLYSLTKGLVPETHQSYPVPLTCYGINYFLTPFSGLWPHSLLLLCSVLDLLGHPFNLPC
ncbi:hypothetical protein FKM82_028158 [Ascaphus truei]